MEQAFIQVLLQAQLHQVMILIQRHETRKLQIPSTGAPQHLDTAAEATSEKPDSAISNVLRLDKGSCTKASEVLHTLETVAPSILTYFLLIKRLTPGIPIAKDRLV